MWCPPSLETIVLQAHQDKPQSSRPHKPGTRRVRSACAFLVALVALSPWASHSAPDLSGLPLTEEFHQQLPDGAVWDVQYFERARMEWHPELPQGRRVQLGLLGPGILNGNCRGEACLARTGRLPTLASPPAAP